MAWTSAVRLGDLTCTRANGETCRFEVRVLRGSQSDGELLYCYARPFPIKQQGEKEYSAQLRWVESDLLQMEFMTNRHLSARFHRGWGITRELMPLLATHYSARIRSSRRKAEGESHSDSARRFWEGMVRDGLASHSPSDDRFYYPAFRD